MAFKSNKEKSTKVGVLVVISFVSLFLGVGITKFNSFLVSLRGKRFRKSRLASTNRMHHPRGSSALFLW